jgi:uncharacterized protein
MTYQNYEFRALARAGIRPRQKGICKYMCLFVSRLLYAFLIYGCSIGFAYAEPAYPALNGKRVVDAANVIPTATRSVLEAKLATLEAKTSAQIVIATVPDLQGYAVEEFTVGLLRNWKLGQKDKNNGALIFLSLKERKVRIEVGYGLEGALTDATTKLIISNGMVPRLRANDYGGAFTRAVDDVSSVVSGEAADQGWKGTPTPRPHGSDTLDWGQILIGLLVFGFFIWLQTRSNRRAGLRGGFGQNIIILPGFNWGGGGGYSGGGGGFGGFSGGGGSGGGGGASGDY